MRYESIVAARFVSRPNRFVATVELDGRTEIAHVKNTGRCRELFVPGALVYLQKAANPQRKTPYDLVAVEKGERLVNVDSMAPNKVFAEWLPKSGLLPPPLFIRPEATFSRSRFDFYVEAGKRKMYAEIKGVTLEENGVALFPDAPTLRGIKHLEELALCRQQGFEALAAFVIQMEGVRCFRPNMQTHPAFAQALKAAAAQGVRVVAVDCLVTKNSLSIHNFVPVEL